MKIKIIFNILVFIWFSELGLTQSLIPDSTRPLSDSKKKRNRGGIISVRSEFTGVRVFIDTTFLGTTPVENYVVAEGAHVLRFIHPANNEWLNSTVVETIFVHPSDHIERTAIFPHRWTIRSEPYGAIVQHQDSVIGTTPMILSAISAKYIIRLTKENFQDIIIPLSNTGGEINMKMEPVERLIKNKYSSLQIEKQSDIPSSVYIAGGTVVVSGTVAAYFKIKSDRLYKDYRNTNSGSTLNQVRKLDIVSGVSLAVSEISLFLLSYLLLSK